MSFLTHLLTTVSRLPWLALPPGSWESAANGPWVFELLGRHAENHMDPAKPWSLGNWPKLLAAMS